MQVRGSAHYIGEEGNSNIETVVVRFKPTLPVFKLVLATILVDKLY